MSLNKIPLFISSEIALPPAGKDVLINTGYKYAIGSYNESDGCFWFDGDCWCKGNVEWADIEHIIDAVKDINENIENGKIVEKKIGHWITEGIDLCKLIAHYDKLSNEYMQKAEHYKGMAYAYATAADSIRLAQKEGDLDAES